MNITSPKKIDQILFEHHFFGQWNPVILMILGVLHWQLCYFSIFIGAYCKLQWLVVECAHVPRSQQSIQVADGHVVVSAIVSSGTRTWHSQEAGAVPLSSGMSKSQTPGRGETVAATMWQAGRIVRNGFWDSSLQMVGFPQSAGHFWLGGNWAERGILMSQDSENPDRRAWQKGEMPCISCGWIFDALIWDAHIFIEAIDGKMGCGVVHHLRMSLERSMTGTGQRWRWLLGPEICWWVSLLSIANSAFPRAISFSGFVSGYWLSIIFPINMAIRHGFTPHFQTAVFEWNRSGLVWAQLIFLAKASRSGRAEFQIWIDEERSTALPHFPAFSSPLW